MKKSYIDNLLAGQVDRLGVLRAELKVLADEAKEIEAHLKSQGAGVYNGDLFVVKVSETSTRRVDWKEVAERLEPSRQLVAAHTSTSEGLRLVVSAFSKKAVA